MTVMDIVENNWVPDALIRAGIRRKVRQRGEQLAVLAAGDPALHEERYAESLTRMALAIHTEDANRQHYELPTSFFQEALGARLKYSSALWEDGVADLDAAEEAMLALTADRAELGDGQRILDLGCGWGSLSLYAAERFPGSTITAVSNSGSQRQFIEARALERGLANLRVITADIRDLELAGGFDRVVSVEMFEHLKNYHELFRRIAGWLSPQGKLFTHVFVHDRIPYPFEAGNDGEWMARYFFTGGMMPSFGLLPRFSQHLVPEESWRVNGRNYERTANAWLVNMDAARDRLRPVFEETYGAEADRWWSRWRIFFMACAEMFGYAEGRTWYVGHYRFGRR